MVSPGALLHESPPSPPPPRYPAHAYEIFLIVAPQRRDQLSRRLRQQPRLSSSNPHLSLARRPPTAGAPSSNHHAALAPTPRRVCGNAVLEKCGASPALLRAVRRAQIDLAPRRTPSYTLHGTTLGSQSPSPMDSSRDGRCARSSWSCRRQTWEESEPLLSRVRHPLLSGHRVARRAERVAEWLGRQKIANGGHPAAEHASLTSVRVLTSTAPVPTAVALPFDCLFLPTMDLHLLLLPHAQIPALTSILFCVPPSAGSYAERPLTVLSLSAAFAKGVRLCIACVHHRILTYHLLSRSFLRAIPSSVEMR